MKLKNHFFSILAAIGCLALAVIAGCQHTGTIFTGPAGTQPASSLKVTQDQLAQLDAEKQAEFQTRENALKAQIADLASKYDAALAAQAAAQDDAAKATAAAALAAIQQRQAETSASLNAALADEHVWEVKAQSALDQIQAKRAAVGSMVEAGTKLGGAAAEGAVNPSSLIVSLTPALLSLLGIGAIADKHLTLRDLRKQNSDAAGA